MSKMFSVIIPCLNEEKAIPLVLQSVAAIQPKLISIGFDHLEILVVDDHSTDRSWELLQNWPNVRAVRNEFRRNYGGSLKIGFQKARGDVLGFLDMDSTYDPAEFISMLQQLGGSGPAMVCGDRLSTRTQMPILRKVGNLFFIKSIHALFRRSVLDSCTGQRVFPRELAALFVSLPVDGLNFSLSMTLACLTNGIRFIEIPISYRARVGQSKLSIIRDGFRFARTIVATWSAQKLGFVKLAQNETPIVALDHIE